MKKNLFFLVLFCVAKVFSQNIDFICDVTDKIGYSVTDLSVEFYKSDTYIKERYQQFSDVKNSTPEELLKSHISAKDNEWLSYNYGKDVTWEDSKIKELLNENNYIELLFRLNFRVSNKEYSIVKLNAKSKSSSIPIALLMKKNEGRWVFTDEKILQSLKLIIYLLPIGDIYSIFNNETRNDNRNLDIFRDKIWIDNSFNFYAFINGFGEYLLKNDNKNDISLGLKENISLEINTKGIIPFINQEFCTYFKNENSRMQNPYINKVIDSIQKITNQKVYPLNSVKVTINEKNFFYLKYIEIDGNKTYNNVMVFDDNFNIINQQDEIYKLLDSSNQENLKNIFSNSKIIIIYK
ncbi:hypothetical protein EDL99_02615 [Ornithobacterium rhinotracheale]|uniref:hypothetical protein n=1 Tax=Ornithobacterium rhinotracheale TaxID=28251 RepID=UPI00129C9310|nr:hypothetical protein [Ornithobacterium rhinotracheale]MRJ07779.1 hypothetical protein [Ornithobacterium rhinotracheale]UOH78700.1 hypothetical protein MT996_04325 [Ornithobacterium rhinotracheale]